MSALGSRAMVQAPFSRRPCRVACSAKLNQVSVSSKRPVRRQAVVKEEGSPYLPKPSPISPGADFELLDLLPVGSALFGLVVAPSLLDLAGVSHPAWWQTFLASVGAGVSTVLLGNLGYYITKTNISKQQSGQQREELLRDRTLIVELIKCFDNFNMLVGTFQSPTVYDMVSATSNESAKLTEYLQTAAEDIFGEKYEGAVLLGIDPEGKETRLLLRPGTTVEGVLVTSLKGLVLRVKKVEDSSRSHGHEPS